MFSIKFENCFEFKIPHTWTIHTITNLTVINFILPDDVPDQLPTDNDLQSWYATTPAAKRIAPEPPAAIPETPSPCKVKSSQQIVADKLLEKAKSPKRSSVARRNMFAVKGRKSDRERRLQQLKGDKITSR